MTEMRFRRVSVYQPDDVLAESAHQYSLRRLQTIAACTYDTLATGSYGVERRIGLSLIEVVTAVTILGASVTTLLTVLGRSVESMRDDERKMVARDIATELITEWQLRKVDVTVEESGRVAEHPGWLWHRRVKIVSVRDDVELNQVTLELAFQSPEARRSGWSREFHWLAPDRVE